MSDDPIDTGTLESLRSELAAAQAALAHRESQLVALERAAIAMSLSFELPVQLEALARIASEIAGADRAYVVWRDEEELDRLLGADERGGTWRLPEEAVRSLSISRRAIETGQPVVEAAGSHCACLPLIAPGRVLGALVVEGGSPGEAELAALAAVAAQATLALEQAALHAALKRRSAMLEATLTRYREANHEAHTDPLTGLANRRHFREVADREWAASQRYHRTFSIMMSDIDFFKRFNDAHGHAIGDLVLREVASTLAGGLRMSDLVARYGGEEFIVLCPDTGEHEAAQLADRLRQAVGKVALFDADGRPLPPIAISFGVAALEGPDDTMDRVIERADQALYTAKESGRNRVVRASAPELTPGH